MIDIYGQVHFASKRDLKLIDIFKSNNRTLTVREIFDYGYNSPTKVISNLRKEGYHIKDRWLVNYESGTKFKVYTLEDFDYDDKLDVL